MIAGVTVALLAQAIGFAFALGALLLLILTFLPATRAAARQLWPVLGSEAAILAAGLIPWLLPHPVLLVILLLAAWRIGYESAVVHGLVTGKDLRAGYSMSLVLASGLSWFLGTTWFILVAAAILVFAVATILMAGGRTVAGTHARFLVFPLLPLAAFSHAAANPQLAPLLILAFFLVEIFDSFSLLGGKLYGRTPLVPRLSPRKTWEGLATGAGATLVALLLLVALNRLELVPMLVAGVIVVMSAVAGDLLGSLAKRRAGVKDYPAVMTVQGGLLDITDAWLLAGPCLCGFIILLNLL